MKSYKILQKEFEHKVEVLQSRCKHIKSTVMEEWWAIGHSTGNQVKICDFCNKKLETLPMEFTEESNKQEQGEQA